MTKTDEEKQEALESKTIKFSLIMLIISGSLQIVLLLALYPISRLYKKALTMQNLTSFLSDSNAAKWSIRVFILAYITRSIVGIAHGYWAVVMFRQFNKDQISSEYVIEQFSSNELFLLAESIVELCTITLCTVFFVILGRNIRSARKNLQEI